MTRTLTNRCAERVIAHVSARTGVGTADILGASRLPAHVAPRHRTMRILHRLGYTAVDIGRALDRNHTTVLYAVRGRA